MYKHKKPEKIEGKPWEAGTKTRYLNVSITQELWNGIANAAMVEGVDKGELVRRALWNYVMGDKDDI